MVVFTLTSQILDTILIKGTAFIITQTYDVLTWGGYKVYTYYIPPPLSKQEVLENKVLYLEHQINLLTDKYEEDYIIVDANKNIDNS